MEPKPSFKSTEGILHIVVTVVIMLLSCYLIYKSVNPIDSELQRQIVTAALERAETTEDIAQVKALATREPIDYQAILQSLAVLIPGLLSLWSFAGKRTDLKKAAMVAKQ